MLSGTVCYCFGVINFVKLTCSVHGNTVAIAVDRIWLVINAWDGDGAEVWLTEDGTRGTISVKERVSTVLTRIKHL